MNETQRRIALAIIACIIAMALHPPFAVVGAGPKRFMGYYWLWERPGQVPIDLATLVTQWVGALVVGALAMWASSGRRPIGEPPAFEALVETGTERQASRSTTSRLRPSDKDLNGIDGWLFVLVVGLILGGPSAYLKNVADGLSLLPQLDAFPSMQRALKFDWIAGGVLAAFSVFAGARLLRKHPAAPTTATSYLGLAGLYFIAAPFIVMGLISGVGPVGDQSLDVSLVNAYVRQAISGLLYVGVWTVYLRVSKRMKATFPDAYARHPTPGRKS